MSEPIGGLLDSLGVEWTPADGSLVAGAVVLLKVVDGNGGVTLRTCHNPGMSWIERVGMFRAAEQSDLNDMWQEDAE